MNHSQKQRLLWVTLIIALGAGIVWQWAPMADASKRLAALPTEEQNVASRDLPLTEAESSIFGKANVVKRVYAIRDQKIVVVVIDGTHDRHGVHDPLYCFRGAGWTLEAQEELDLPRGKARYVRFTKGSTRTEMVYWISDGKRRHYSPTRYWGQTALRRLTLGSSGAEPVLVLLQPAGREPIRWREALDEFPALLEL